MQIIVPMQHRSDGTPFGDLVRDERELAKAVNAVIRMVQQSFVDDRRRQMQGLGIARQTEREEKRRVDICGAWFRTTRGDFGWSLVKTLDELPKALRAELDGAEYKPPAAGRLWVPGGAT